MPSIPKPREVSKEVPSTRKIQFAEFLEKTIWPDFYLQTTLPQNNSNQRKIRNNNLNDTTLSKTITQNNSRKIAAQKCKCQESTHRAWESSYSWYRIAIDMGQPYRMCHRSQASHWISGHPHGTHSLGTIPSRLQDEGIIKNGIGKILKQQVIKLRQTKWAAPVVFASIKPERDDFALIIWKINPVTNRDSYPISRMDEFIDSLGEATICYTPDANSTY